MGSGVWIWAWGAGRGGGGAGVGGGGGGGVGGGGGWLGGLVGRILRRRSPWLAGWGWWGVGGFGFGFGFGFRNGMCGILGFWVCVGLVIVDRIWEGKGRCMRGVGVLCMSRYAYKRDKKRSGTFVYACPWTKRRNWS